MVTIRRMSDRAGCNLYISFIFTEGQSASPTIIPSLRGANERYELAVTCPDEVRVT